MNGYKQLAQEDQGENYGKQPKFLVLPQKISQVYRHAALYRIFYHFVANRSQSASFEFSDHTYYDEAEPAMAQYRNYADFDYDVRDLDTLVEFAAARCVDLRASPRPHAPRHAR